MRRLSPLLLAGIAVALASACAREVQRYDRDQIADVDSTKSDPAARGLVLGEFPLKPGGVVDGDTIRVGGLDDTLRLLGMDTEETFKSDKDRRLFEAGWAAYLYTRASESSRPVKIPTPLGEDAKHFAQDWFRGITRVRVERDHPKELRGHYDRHLAYVFAEKNGEWVNYNIEAVRAGMSPYFAKYGHSRRFQAEFESAQAEARAAERGIWAPGAQAYPDYDARLKWWNARGDFVARFEAIAAEKPDHVALSRFDAPERIASHEGREVTILATIGDIRYGEGRAPTRVLLSRKQFSDFPLIVWDRRILEDSGLEKYVGEFIAVRGIVSSWTNPHDQSVRLQIELTHPRQVQLPNYQPPGPTPAEAP